MISKVQNSWFQSWTQQLRSAKKNRDVKNVKHQMISKISGALKNIPGFDPTWFLSVYSMVRGSKTCCSTVFRSPRSWEATGAEGFHIYIYTIYKHGLKMFVHLDIFATKTYKNYAFLFCVFFSIYDKTSDRTTMNLMITNGKLGLLKLHAEVIDFQHVPKIFLMGCQWGNYCNIL